MEQDDLSLLIAISTDDAKAKRLDEIKTAQEALAQHRQMLDDARTKLAIDQGKAADAARAIAARQEALDKQEADLDAREAALKKGLDDLEREKGVSRVAYSQGMDDIAAQKKLLGDQITATQQKELAAAAALKEATDAAQKVAEAQLAAEAMKTTYEAAHKKLVDGLVNAIETSHNRLLHAVEAYYDDERKQLADALAAPISGA